MCILYKMISEVTRARKELSICKHLRASSSLGAGKSKGKGQERVGTREEKMTIWGFLAYGKSFCILN